MGTSSDAEHASNRCGSAQPTPTRNSPVFAESRIGIVTLASATTRSLRESKEHDNAGFQAGQTARTSRVPSRSPFRRSSTRRNCRRCHRSSAIRACMPRSRSGCSATTSTETASGPVPRTRRCCGATRRSTRSRSRTSPCCPTMRRSPGSSRATRTATKARIWRSRPPIGARPGVVDADGNRHKVAAYLALPVGNLDDVKNGVLPVRRRRDRHQVP